MKNKRGFYIAFSFSIVLILYYYLIFIPKKLKSIEKNGIYVIAKIHKKTPGKYFHYEFYINDERYENPVSNISASWHNSDRGVHIGNKYLAVVSRSNLNIGVIIWQKPISESDDTLNLINQPVDMELVRSNLE